jgi:7,8-dihydropterin-6-yl-methyl-4-(beta-D-ribofuranosyl)aminobenzene 5'-phosphate synthase
MHDSGNPPTQDPPGLTERVTLQPVDRAEVTILVDNAIDVLVPSTPLAQRPPWAWEWSAQPQLRAEHGYSLLLTVTRGDQRDTIVYDAGLGRDTILHNMDVLGINPADVRTVVMSHGHADHHGGLEGLYRRIGRMGLPLVLHPAIWTDRRIVFPTGVEIHMPPPSRQDLDREGWQVVEERGPSLLLNDTVLVTGQVPRVTDFERGMPVHQMRVADHWEPDVWIWDDQAVVIHVAGQGLVVLSSCSHAGAINVLRHAQRLTGVDQILAFVGGMHLTGGLFEPIIPATVAALAKIAPSVIVPGHCSGWRAIHAVAARLPDAFIQSNLGTCLHFTGAAPAA